MGGIFIYTSTARGVPRAPLVFSLMLVTEAANRLRSSPRVRTAQRFGNRVGLNCRVCVREGYHYRLIHSSIWHVIQKIQTKDYGLQKIGFTILLILYKLYIRTVKQSCSSLANYGTFDECRWRLLCWRAPTRLTSWRAASVVPMLESKGYINGRYNSPPLTSCASHCKMPTDVDVRINLLFEDSTDDKCRHCKWNIKSDVCYI